MEADGVRWKTVLEAFLFLSDINAALCERCPRAFPPPNLSVPHSTNTRSISHWSLVIHTLSPIGHLLPT